MTNNKYMQWHKSHKYYTEPKKPDKKECIVYYSICMKFKGEKRKKKHLNSGNKNSFEGKLDALIRKSTKELSEVTEMSLKMWVAKFIKLYA